MRDCLVWGVFEISAPSNLCVVLYISNCLCTSTATNVPRTCHFLVLSVHQCFCQLSLYLSNSFIVYDIFIFLYIFVVFFYAVLLLGLCHVMSNTWVCSSVELQVSEFETLQRSFPHYYRYLFEFGYNKT